MQSEETRASFCRGAIRAQWMERRRKLTGVLSDLLRRGVKTGDIRKDIPPETIAACLLGMLRGFTMQSDRGKDGESSLDGLIDLFLGGAAASRARIPNRDGQ